MGTSSHGYCAELRRGRSGELLAARACGWSPARTARAACWCRNRYRRSTFVGREGGGVLAGRRGQAGERAALAVHLIEVIFVGAVLAGGEEERATCRATAAALSTSQLPEVRARGSPPSNGDGVKLRVAGALGLEVDFAIVLHPAQRCWRRDRPPRRCRGRVIQNARLAGGGVEREDPAVLEIGGAAGPQRRVVARLRTRRAGRNCDGASRGTCRAAFWPWSAHLTSPVAASMMARRDARLAVAHVGAPVMSST